LEPYTFHQNLCDLWRFEIFDTLSKHVEERGDRVKFVQVGANVGTSDGDPVFPYVKYHGWRGALVEPVPYLFEKLKSNYRDYPGLEFFDLCCSGSEGRFPFYIIEESAATDSILAPFLSSFDKDVILKHTSLIPNLENYIKEIDMHAVRVDTIIDRANLRGFNALIVDTEGHDDLVVAGLNLDTHAPELIMIEHRHLRFESLRSNHERLLDYGYEPIWMFSDIIYLRKADLNYPLLKKITNTSEIMYRI
jgi:FkbM family methyltransferase